MPGPIASDSRELDGNKRAAVDLLFTVFFILVTKNTYAPADKTTPKQHRK